MNIATLLRYADFGNPDSPWNYRYYIMHDYEIMARELGVGLCAIMTLLDFEKIADQCDGLIVPGTGTNCCPSYYGEPPMDPPPVIDEYGFDSKIIDYFVKHNKPIFGVCGGHQWLNIYFGGTLYNMSDVDSHHNGEKRQHEITITPGSFVHDVFKSEKAITNSYHGQALGKLAPELKAVAVTSDGVIEAVENKERRIFATQWHPEQSFHVDKYAIEKKFFENFLECCRK